MVLADKGEGIRERVDDFHVHLCYCDVSTDGSRIVGLLLSDIGPWGQLFV